MPRQMPTTLRPRILALKPAEEASSSHFKSAAVVPDVNTPSRTVRPPFRLFDPFSAGLDQFQPTAFMAPVRTSVATEFNSGERTYSTIKPRSPSIRKPRQIRHEKLPPDLYKCGGCRLLSTSREKGGGQRIGRFGKSVKSIFIAHDNSRSRQDAEVPQE